MILGTRNPIHSAFYRMILFLSNAESANLSTMAKSKSLFVGVLDGRHQDMKNLEILKLIIISVVMTSLVCTCQNLTNCDFSMYYLLCINYTSAELPMKDSVPPSSLQRGFERLSALRGGRVGKGKWGNLQPVLWKGIKGIVEIRSEI